MRFATLHWWFIAGILAIASITSHAQAPPDAPRIPPTTALGGPAIWPPYEKIEAVLKHWAAELPVGFQLEELGKSVEGRGVYAITMTDPSVPDKNKQHALVTVDVDAATLQGAIDFADAPSITALAVRDDRRFALRAGAPMRLLELDDAAIVLADTALPALGDAAGLTPSPIDDGLLACDADGGLWHVDPGTGDVDPLAPALPGPCASLATPRGEIACLDALWLP